MLPHLPPPKIAALMNRRENSEVIANIFYILMRDFNQPFSEIKKIPIPLAIKLLNKWNKEQKELEKLSKKKWNK